MTQDQLKDEIMRGAHALQGLSPAECLLVMRESLGRPEPAAEVWAGLAEREKRALLLWADLSGALARRDWAVMAEAARAKLRQAMAGMAAWSVKLDAEVRSVRRARSCG